MRDYNKGALGAFLALAALLGTVVQLLTAPGQLRSIAFLILFTALIVVGAWLLGYKVRLKRRTERSLPSVTGLSEMTGYSVHPATPEEVHWVASLEAKVYPPQDAIPEHILREWYSINPNGFFIIRSKRGERVGHLDVLPLRPPTMQAFLEGDIVERQIRGDSLYSASEKGLIRNVYVESIVAPSAWALLAVLSQFGSLLERVCDLANLEHVYAIAASNTGERLMRDLGFEEFKAAESRADHHKLFRVDFSTLAVKISALVGDGLKNPDLIEKVLKMRDKTTLSGL